MIAVNCMVACFEVAHHSPVNYSIVSLCRLYPWSRCNGNLPIHVTHALHWDIGSLLFIAESTQNTLQLPPDGSQLWRRQNSKHCYRSGSIMGGFGRALYAVQYVAIPVYARRDWSGRIQGTLHCAIPKRHSALLRTTMASRKNESTGALHIFNIGLRQ